LLGIQEEEVDNTESSRRNNRGVSLKLLKFMSSKEGILFTQSQKKGIFVLLAAILIAVGVVYVSKSQDQGESTPFIFPAAAVSAEEKAADQILLDINLADSSQWIQLKGIGPVLARRIINYRNVMGGFSSIDQVANVYGLRPEVFEEIKGHIYTNSSTIPASAYNSTSAPRRTELSDIESLDINTAAAEDFEQLPGIGKVLSQRIINYRRALGGFESTAQIGKVFNLDAAVFEQIEPFLYVDAATVPPELLAKKNKSIAVNSTPYPDDKTRGDKGSADRAVTADNRETSVSGDNETNARYISSTRGTGSRPQVVDINLADSALLITLPGIGEKLAPRIVRYRTLLGYFISLDQLKNVYGLSETNLALMSPYLRIGDTSHYPRKELNTAPAYRLAGFPNISRQLGEAIVLHRKQLGWFESWDQVAMVNGMTPSALEELRAYFEL
jgi:DNA uptake protein ComE-like DNA-binding protein